MRLAALLAAAALAACAAPQAAADPFTSARPELLTACVDAAPSREALAQCLGALARPCIAEEGGGSIADVLCWDAEANAWRAQIEQSTEQMRRRAAYRDPARLAAANAAWSAWADAECDYWSWEEGGGSGEQVQRVQCHARLSAERAIDLLLEVRQLTAVQE